MKGASGSLLWREAGGEPTPVIFLGLRGDSVTGASCREGGCGGVPAERAQRHLLALPPGDLSFTGSHGPPSPFQAAARLPWLTVTEEPAFLCAPATPPKSHHVTINGKLADISKLGSVSPTLRMRHRTEQHAGVTPRRCNNRELTGVERPWWGPQASAMADTDGSVCGSWGQEAPRRGRTKRGDTIYRPAWNYTCFDNGDNGAPTHSSMRLDPFLSAHPRMNSNTPWT